MAAKSSKVLGDNGKKMYQTTSTGQRESGENDNEKKQTTRLG